MLSTDNGVGGHPLFVDNGMPLQLYCPSQASAAHDLNACVIEQ